jgi:dTDP-4-dehydrorhamnose reductase
MECTRNRVGDRYFDQLDRTGHTQRLSDLDLFAGLGISAIRYPLLWERLAPDRPEEIDFTWADERLARLSELGIRPIAGLLHHGSGPAYTSLLDPAFPELFARYARAVAERFPHIDAYTPVNEPLTTARFSGLYGQWYPHRTTDANFLRILIAECRAIVLAMREVRKVNPAAQLITTEDMGKTYSTAPLAYQAAFENDRRWLSLDLLAGCVDASHPLRAYLTSHGISEHELAWFEEHACLPDVVGINHYLTSERFLDHEMRRYPPQYHGGNGLQQYAEVEAVSVRGLRLASWRGLLSEVLERYGQPVAITETHLGCTREEQMRWIVEAWKVASRLRDEGKDVRAVTAWSMLGAYDWNSLVTRDAGFYEPGVFDVRGPSPRPTALAATLRQLANGGIPDHPVIATRGWWQRADRYHYRPSAPVERVA